MNPQLELLPNTDRSFLSLAPQTISTKACPPYMTDNGGHCGALLITKDMLALTKKGFLENLKNKQMRHSCVSKRSKILEIETGSECDGINQKRS